MKKRSPYAKSLESKQYRQQIKEHKRIDIDDWIEEALEEYYNDKVSTEKNEATEENTTTVRSRDRSLEQAGQSDGALVEVPEIKTKRDQGGHKE